MAQMTQEELLKNQGRDAGPLQENLDPGRDGHVRDRAGAQDTFFALRDELRKQKLAVDVKKSGCVGKCSRNRSWKSRWKVCRRLFMAI